MKNIKVIFTLDEIDISMQCSKDDKMRDICQKFAIKVETNLNSLVFLYEGNLVNSLYEGISMVSMPRSGSLKKKAGALRTACERRAVVFPIGALNRFKGKNSLFMRYFVPMIVNAPNLYDFCIHYHKRTGI